MRTLDKILVGTALLSELLSGCAEKISPEVDPIKEVAAPTVCVKDPKLEIANNSGQITLLVYCKDEYNRDLACAQVVNDNAKPWRCYFLSKQKQ